MFNYIIFQRRDIEMAKLYIDEYSKKGLRTLVLGKKRLSEQDYRNWKDEYNVNN